MIESLDLKISHNPNVKELLKFIVETTKKTLECDRVIVYSASEFPKPLVLAESVDAKYPSILGKTINDPFLEGEYLEMYHYGLPVVINDIEATDISQSHLENLKKLEIKGLAIAPISVENKLLALLVAHQCSTIKPWYSDKVHVLTEKANATGLALSNIVNADKSQQLKIVPEQKPDSPEKGDSLIIEPKENGNSYLQQRKHNIVIQEDRSGLFSEVKDKIANQLGQENILNTTVEEVGQLLNCDRVVVYSLSQDNYGLIVAESVAPSWTNAQDKIIDDPGLATKYIEQYGDGRPWSCNNIYYENAALCYLEQLETFEVRANLVAPIISDGKLFGLLIVYQCSDSHKWQETEINWISEIVSQVGLMLESQKNFTETAQEKSPELRKSESKWNQHFTDAIQYIRQSITKEDILKASVKEVRRVLNCDRVVVYSMNQQNRGMIVAESVAAGWTRAQGRVINDPCFEAKYLDQYRNGRVRAWSDIYTSGLTRCYIEQLEVLQVKANLVTPIINEGNLFGLLVAHQCSDTRDWQEPEVRWVAQIATQVGFALDNAKLLGDAKQLQNQLENEAKLTKYFTDATRYIRESLHQEDILEVTVEEVRRVLNCDRVVVYSMNQDNYGMIVAESVAPGWTRAEGKVIKDPCFESRYLDKYRNGRVRAWSNIYDSGFTSCYIQQLEQLEVKANLVTPIVNEGKLFGLLVAHQCSNTREWQHPEIRWVTDIATQVGFALDNAQILANAKGLRQQIDEESKWTEYFTDVIHHIRHSLKTEDILQTSVREVRRILECDRVVLYSLNQNLRYGTVIAESLSPGWTRALGKKIDDPCFEPTYREKYLNGRARAWNNIRESGMSQCYIEQLEKLEVKANLVTPVINEGKLFGLLVAHECSNPRQWQQTEIRWMSEIATQVGFALDNAKLLADAQKLTQQVEEESKWTDYFTDAIQHIRQSLQTGDILKTSVQEVRRILNCDRVVVYSLNQDNYGMIVAESVAAGWTRAQGRVINDPCFEARYLAQYRNGRVRAWSNIYTSGLTSCYIQQLEQLEVKANLVTPIINEGKLFGLLVAHQCSDTREWQQPEIRWVAQIATQVGFALDNAQLLEQLAQSTQTSNQISHQQYEQIATLKHQVVKILAENGDAYQTLSQEAMRQSETTIQVWHQIQEVADFLNTMALNVQQVKFQEQQNDLAIQTSQESFERAVNSISNIQRTVQNVGSGFDNLSNSCQQLSETVNTIKDLSKQIVQQSMSITRAVNRSQIEENDQNSLIDLSDTIFSLMQGLFEATAKVEHLFANIKTEVREKTVALDHGTQQLIRGVGEFQTVRQKLDRVITMNNKMGSLIENISKSVENQLQSSTSAKDSVQQVVSIAEGISEQSVAITQSFNQLVLLVQQL